MLFPFTLIVAIGCCTLAIVVRVGVVLAALHLHEVFLRGIVISSIVGILVAAPHALRIVRWGVLAKACATTIINGGAAMHRLTAVYATPFSVCRRTGLKLSHFTHVMLVDRDDLAL